MGRRSHPRMAKSQPTRLRLIAPAAIPPNPFAPSPVCVKILNRPFAPLSAFPLKSPQISANDGIYAIILMRRLIIHPKNYAQALRAATRSTLRTAAWNALLIVSGLLLIALAAEIYLRMANPLLEYGIPSQFVDGVGVILKPNAELRYANWSDDNFVVTQTNSQGFPDREPPSPESAADECRIAFIGDSFVEAAQVPISDKFHVRLEQMAARQLPHLRITTQAYGISSTGQINQLPFYDEYARHLNPKLLVLVFFLNDFVNNSTAAQSLLHGADPDRMPYASAYRDANGALKLRPPDPEYERFLLPRLPQPWHLNAWNRLSQVSYFANWLNIKKMSVNRTIRRIRAALTTPPPIEPDPQLVAWANIIAARPCCTSILDDWLPLRIYDLAVGYPFMENHLPPIFQDALQDTAFGIDQFKQRADHDDVALAILAAAYHMGTHGDPQFDRLNAIAQPRGIPIISDYDYIITQGHHPEAALWRDDPHWNASGHQWAAEAILEWLKANQHVCD